MTKTFHCNHAKNSIIGQIICIPRDEAMQYKNKCSVDTNLTAEWMRPIKFSYRSLWENINTLLKLKELQKTKFSLTGKHMCKRAPIW